MSTILLLSLLFCAVFGQENNSFTRPNPNYRAKTIFINSSIVLEQYLCAASSPSYPPRITLLLDSSVKFFLSPDTLCQIKNRIVEIRTTRPPSQAIVTCLYDKESDSRFGLRIINSAIEISHVTLLNCGADLAHHGNPSIQSNHTTPFHAVVLYCINSRLILNHVKIFSHGFAIITVNLYEGVLNDVTISNQNETFKIDEYYGPAIGSGILLYFEDRPTYGSTLHKVIISRTTFIRNYNMDLKLNAAGLTINYLQTKFTAIVILEECYFYKNNAKLSGGVLILQSNTASRTVFANSIFEENFNFPDSAGGGGLVLKQILMTVPRITSYYSKQPLKLESLEFLNTTFLNHRPAKMTHPYGPKNKTGTDGGVIHLEVANPYNFRVIVEIIFRDCTFIHNTVYWTGACIFATGYNGVLNSPAVVVMENMVARNNSNIGSQTKSTISGTESGVFVFYGFRAVIIQGESIFDNHFGIVFLSLDTTIILSGDVTFTNNRAMFGPAITQSGECQIYFASGVNALFANNTAQIEGGAIYTTGHSQAQIGLCAIQIINSENTSISFVNNNAQRAGSSIYAVPLMTCMQNGTLWDHNPEGLLEYYNHFLSFTSPPNSTILDMSTIAPYVTQEDRYASYHIYPGQEIKLCLYAYAYHNGSVHTVVLVDLKCYTIDDEYCPIWVDRKDSEKILQEHRQVQCTNISFVVRTRNDSQPTDGILYLSANGGLPNVAAMYSNEYNVGSRITISPCPLGFVLNSVTGSCICSPSFYELAKAQPTIIGAVDCNLTTQTISRAVATNSWAGIATEGATEVSVSMSCPITYCNSDKSLAYFYTNFTSSFNENFILTDSQKSIHYPLCLHNRGGIMCGQCRELNGHKLSAVFGSNQCKQCSNWWLFTILVYAFAGPLLILILFALKLTLTSGTINGIIFYAQAANCGLLDIFDTYCSDSTVESLSKFSQVFVSLLNTNMVFGLCFYDGMTEVWKAGLGLIFPLYLLAIIGFIVILCRFSVRIANKIARSSVQVLVTVLYLSFSRLILQLINVFSSATIYKGSSTRNVWLFDGSIDYWSTPHCILIVITLVVVLSLLLPYMGLLIFAKPLRPFSCTNNYLRPFLEAIHAPYKEGKQYWFTLRLVLVCAMFMVYAFYRATNVFMTYVIINPTLLLFMIAQTYAKPFKSMTINVLDTWLTINFIVFNLTSWYFYIRNQTIAMKSFTIASVMLTFVTFIIILAYHFLWVTGMLDRCKKCYTVHMQDSVCCQLLKKIFKSRGSSHHREQRRLMRHQMINNISAEEEEYYEECDNFRESLLEGEMNKKAAD